MFPRRMIGDDYVTTEQSTIVRNYRSFDGRPKNADDKLASLQASWRNGKGRFLVAAHPEDGSLVTACYGCDDHETAAFLMSVKETIGDVPSRHLEGSGASYEFRTTFGVGAPGAIHERLEDHLGRLSNPNYTWVFRPTNG